MGRYWIGDSGTWSDTTHWSTSSGGGGGASVPTGVDPVHFDHNSFTLDSQAVTLVSTQSCYSIDCSDVTHNFSFGTLNRPLTVYENVNIPSGVNVSTIQLTISTQLDGMLTCSSSYSFNSVNINKTLFSGHLGTVSLGDTLRCGAFTMTHGYFYTLGNDMNISSWDNSLDQNPKYVYLYGSTINVTGGSWTTYDSPYFTIDAGTSIIKMNYNNGYFYTAKRTYYNLECTATNVYISGAGIFNDIKGTAGKKIALASNQTISSLSGVGTSGNEIYLYSTISSTQRTLTCANNVTVSYWKIRDNKITGGYTYTAHNSVDVSGNSGWVFDQARTVPSTPSINFGTFIPTVVIVDLSRLKYWNGSAWVAKSLKYWNGSAWTTKVLKGYNGSTWK